MTEERIPASTLEKYYRVSAPREEKGAGPKNEIRISQKSDRIGQYIMYAINLFLKDNEDSVIIKATGNAVVKCVLIAEILRHRIPDLHQINKISSTEVKDTWRPKEEGLDTITTTKTLAVLEIKLTLKPTSQELKDPSYQKPLPADQVEKIDLNNPYPARESGYSRGGDRGERPFGRGFGGRRGGRGGPGRGFRRGNARRGGDFRDRDEEVYRQPPPKDFEPENFRRGAPQQRRGGDYRDRRDEDYDRRPQRGGYRDDRRDFRDDRRDYREDRRDYRDDRRDFRDDRRDYREDRRDDDRERGFGGRGGFRGGRGGGFRGGRGGFRGSRGGRF